MAGEGLRPLREMEYPGRGIVVGRVSTAKGVRDVVAYFITGRSPPSQARKLIFNKKEKRVFVKPTDESLVNEGNRDLLIYPAISVGKGFVAVSNGRQTQSIEEAVSSAGPMAILSKAHAEWSYEPDAPHYTPRISAIAKRGDAAFAIIRRGKIGQAQHESFRTVLEPGEFRMVTTYSGENRNPLPSFNEPPMRVNFNGRTPSEIAEEIYAVISKEHKVAVAVAFHDPNTGDYDVEIRNRHELEARGVTAFFGKLKISFRKILQHIKYKGLFAQ